MTRDRDQILERLADVATALDSRDWDGLGALFTDSATGYGASGREAIIAIVRQHLGGCGPSQHLLGNHRVHLALDGDEDRAGTLTYARVLHIGTGDQSGLTYECFGEYSDLWTRTPEGWRIDSRRFRIDFDRGEFRTLQPG
ncbi:MAG: nuclear transport factor 2 family protein [Dietzia sp.]